MEIYTRVHVARANGDNGTVTKVALPYIWVALDNGGTWMGNVKDVSII